MSVLTETVLTLRSSLNSTSFMGNGTSLQILQLLRLRFFLELANLLEMQYLYQHMEQETLHNKVNGKVQMRGIYLCLHSLQYTLYEKIPFIWGYRFTLWGKTEVFYTHLDSVVAKGAVKKGDLLGYVGQPPPADYAWATHLHIALKEGKLSTYLDATGKLI